MRRTTGIKIEDLTDEHTSILVGAMQEAGVPLSPRYSKSFQSADFVRKRLAERGYNPVELRVNEIDQNKILLFNRKDLVVDLILDEKSSVREAGGVEAVESRYIELFNKAFPDGGVYEY